MKRLFLFGCLCLHLISLGAQPCDSSVKPSPNPSLAYKARQNRCEGFYTAQVGSASFELVGCTLGEFRFQRDQGEVITLEVPGATGTGGYNIRAMGIPTNLYYRMDAQLTAGKSLNWDVATSLWQDNRSRYDYNIGLLAFQEKAGSKIYTPVKSKSKLLPTAAGSNAVSLKFRISRPLGSLRWKIGNGSEQDYGKPLPPANQPITLQLPANLDKGLHTVSLIYRVLNTSDPLVQTIQIQL